MMVIILCLATIMKGNKKGNKKFIIIAAFIMFCILGLRDVTSIGMDTTTSYVKAYKRYGTTDWHALPSIKDGEFNIGFYYLIKVIYTISSGDYQLFIAVIAAFVMLVLAHFIKRYSVSPIQSFVYYWGLLHFIFMFSALKQSIAMSFALLAFDAIVDRKPAKFVLLVFAGSLFHFPVLVFLPAYWIAKMGANKKFIVLLVILLVVTYVFRAQFLSFMMKAYGGDAEKMLGKEAKFLGNKVVIMLMIAACALILRPPTPKDRIYGILFQFVCLAAVFQTFCGYDNIFDRLADYYFQFAIVLIPLIFEKSPSERPELSQQSFAMAKGVAPYLFGGFGMWRFASYVKSCGSIFLPYLFYFQVK